MMSSSGSLLTSSLLCAPAPPPDLSSHRVRSQESPSPGPAETPGGLYLAPSGPKTQLSSSRSESTVQLDNTWRSSSVILGPTLGM